MFWGNEFLGCCERTGFFFVDLRVIDAPNIPKVNFIKIQLKRRTEICFYLHSAFCKNFLKGFKKWFSLLHFLVRSERDIMKQWNRNEFHVKNQNFYTHALKYIFLNPIQTKQNKDKQVRNPFEISSYHANAFCCCCLEVVKFSKILVWYQ